MRERISVSGLILLLLLVAGALLDPPPQRMTERLTMPVIRSGRPMLARPSNWCRIVIVDGPDYERPDRVMVRWPAEDGNGDSWYHGSVPRERLEPLENYP